MEISSTRPIDDAVMRAAFDIARVRVRYYEECKKLIEEKANEGILKEKNTRKDWSEEIMTDEIKPLEKPAAIVKSSEFNKELYDKEKKDIQNLIKVYKIIKSCNY